MTNATWRLAVLAAALVLQGCGRDESSGSREWIEPPAPPAAQVPIERRADFGDEPRSAGVARVADWSVRTNDHQGSAFAVIDKPAARLYVFDADGRLAGSAPVLLGSALGDETVPGIGEKPIPLVKPEERTTPAGRFVAEHGTNLRNEHVIWIDYDAAVSMHPVLTTNPAERRLERLDSPDPAEHRISYGCVNVPTRFFSDVVIATLGPVPHPVVYVLPDARPLAEVFPGLATPAATRAAAAAPRREARGHSLPAL